MPGYQQEYSELLSMTKLLLQQAFSEKKNVFSDEETCSSFQQWTSCAAPSIPKAQAKSANSPKNAPSSPLPASPVSSPLPPSSPAARKVPPRVKKLPPRKPLASSHHVKEKENERIEEDKPSEKAPFLKRAPMDAPPPDSLEDIKKAIQELFPGTRIIEAPPDDALAREINKKKPQAGDVPDVLILSSARSPKHREFLNNIVKAVRLTLITAGVYSVFEIERQGAWEKLFSHKSIKLILAHEQTIRDFPALSRQYKIPPNSSERLLGKIPLILLSDIDSYFTTPLLKQSLWQALCEKLTVGV